MKKVEWSLKVFGVLLGILAFVVSQAEQFPSLLKIVSPGYQRGMKGLEMLRNKKPLKPGEKGFSELSEIVMRRQKEMYPSKDFSAIQVKQFFRIGRLGSTYKGKYADAQTFVGFDLSDGDGGPETIGSLRTGLDQLRSRNVFQLMVILLFVGLAFVEIPTLFFDWPFRKIKI